jgi:hypothetical protein
MLLASVAPSSATTDDGLTEFWVAFMVFGVVALLAAISLTAVVVWAVRSNLKHGRRLRAAAAASDVGSGFSERVATDRR